MAFIHLLIFIRLKKIDSHGWSQIRMIWKDSHKWLQIKTNAYRGLIGGLIGVHVNSIVK